MYFVGAIKKLRLSCFVYLMIIPILLWWTRHIMAYMRKLETMAVSAMTKSQKHVAGWMKHGEEFFAVFLIPPCLCRPLWCLWHLQDEETAHQDDWRSVKVGPWPAKGRRGLDQQRTPRVRVKTCRLQFFKVKRTSHFTVESDRVWTQASTRELSGRWREGREEQLHQRDGEGSGIYVQDRTIWSPACPFSSPTAALTKEHNAQNPSRCHIVFSLKQGLLQYCHYSLNVSCLKGCGLILAAEIYGFGRNGVAGSILYFSWLEQITLKDKTHFCSQSFNSQSL